MGSLQKLEMRQIARGYTRDPAGFIKRMLESGRATTEDSGTVIAGRLGLYMLPAGTDPNEIISWLGRYKSLFQGINARGNIKGPVISGDSGVKVQIVRPARVERTRYTFDVASDGDGLYHISNPASA
ncbi:MAG: hypothetical protein HYW26_00650 [Candidatus Aenigmarchaeota archaeon]|nr:hypothetical protein [Candidatus Aenigmarchaeota archaeon]